VVLEESDDNESDIQEGLMTWVKNSARDAVEEIIDERRGFCQTTPHLIRRGILGYGGVVGRLGQNRVLGFLGIIGPHPQP